MKASKNRSYNILTVFLSLFIAISSCTQFKGGSAEMINILPYSSAVLIKVNNVEKLQGLSEQNLMIASLSKSEKGQEASAFLEELHELGLPLQDGFWLASTMVGLDQTAWAFYQNGPQIQHDKIIEDLSTSGKSKLYEGVHIFEKESKLGSLFIAKLDEIFILSFSDIMLEESIRQAKLQDQLNSAESISKLLQTANNKDPFNLFINPQQSPNWLKQHLPVDWNGISESCGWMGLDAGFPKNALLLNGITQVSDSSGHTLSWFKGNAAQKIKIYQVIPEGVSGVLAFGMGNALQWHRSYEKWLREQNKFEQYQKHLRDYGSPSNVVDAFMSWIDNEAAIFVSENRDNNPEAQIMASFKARNAKDAINQLRTFSTEEGSYRDLPIFRLKFKNITGIVWGKPFNLLHKSYFTYLGSYVIFANSEAGLKTIINEWYLGKTLGNNEGFQDFASNFSNQCHVFGYIQNPSWQSWMKHWMGNGLADSNYSASFNKAAIQLKIEDEYAYTTLYFEKPPKAPTQARVSWNLSLDSSMVGSIHPCINHTNNTKELLVQDQKQQIYLIGNKGNIQWKKQLEGPILGKVHQIDFYKNNKLQLLFNTAEKVHLIDRLGNDVEGYPKRLDQKATAGLALFDYDKARKYRIVIPCGKFVEYWNQEGDFVKGWKYAGAMDTINFVPKHVFAYGKDYILMRNNSNDLQILNRSGEIRVPINQSLNLSKNPLYLVKGASIEQSRIIGTDLNGAQVIIYLDGTIDKLESEVLAPSHEFRQLDDYSVYLNDSELRIESNGELIRKSFDAEQLKQLSIARMNDHIYISFLAEKEQKVYLLNEDGELVDGFPVFGEHKPLLFDLDQDGKPNIIVAGKDGTVYNYRVD